MGFRLRPPPPPLVPPGLDLEAQIDCLRRELGWTRSQAQVVLSALRAGTYREIAEQLSLAESTVHAHFSQLYSRGFGTARPHLTALAVATLWQRTRDASPHGLDHSD